MPLMKCNHWPVVLSNDHGIRPAGEPNACFYCHSIVGQPHGAECVCVQKMVKYRVSYNNIEIGHFSRAEPHFWDDEFCEWHKNESSWCADNATDYIVYDTPYVEEEMTKALANLTSGGGCACRPLSFKFEEIEDPGPLYTLREERNDS